MVKSIVIAFVALSSSTVAKAEYLGQYSTNPYETDSVSNPYGEYGSEYSEDSIKNPYSKYGSKYSSESVNNPYATDTPKLYDSDGNYRGKLSNNKYDPESISNPYGEYGSKYSPESIKNPYGAGNPYLSDSPFNKYGSGLDNIPNRNTESEIK